MKYRLLQSFGAAVAVVALLAIGAILVGLIAVDGKLLTIAAMVSVVSGIAAKAMNTQLVNMW